MNPQSPLNGHNLLVTLVIVGLFIYLAIQQGWFSNISFGEAFSNIEEWFESDFEEWKDKELSSPEEKWSPQEEPKRLKHMAI